MIRPSNPGRFPRGVGILSIAAFGAGCPSLDEIPLGECGNGVIENDIGEECDTPPGSTDEREAGSTYCARPNEPNACHPVWDATTCCPDHRGQGLDGRCRNPSGVFETAVPIARIEEPALGTVAADVDGDGYKDLAIRYLSREIELRLLGPNANPTPIRDIRPAGRNAQVAFGSLTNAPDPSLDDCRRPRTSPTGAVFIPTELGVRILVGRPGGALLPKAFASLDTFLPSLPLALPGLVCPISLDGLESDLPRDFVCPGAFAEAPGVLKLLTLDPKSLRDGPPTEVASFAGLGLDALGDPALQITALPGWAGCDGIVIRFGDSARERSNTVTVLGMCGAGGNAEVLSTLPVPSASRVFSIDVDFDGAGDLVVATQSKLRVLLGDGAGAFGGEAGGYEVAIPALSDEDGLPLAVGFIDEDSALDFVEPYAVWTSRGGCDDPAVECTFEIAGASPENPMVDVVLANVNGDDQLDVVGRARDSEGRTFLVVGTSGALGLFSFDERPIGGLARDFKVADFDGNGIDDVALVNARSEDCSEPDQVQILFGERGVPGDVVTVAEIAGVQGLAAGVIIPSIQQWDGIADLGLASRCANAATGRSDNRATILFGNQARSVDSFYAFPDAGKLQEHLQFATGRLDGDDHPDLVALGNGATDADGRAPLLLWVVRATGDSELEQNDVAPWDTSLSGDYLLGSTALVVGDLDCAAEGDPGCVADEIAVFQSSGASVASSSKDEPRLTIFRSKDEPPVTTASCGLSGSLPYQQAGSSNAEGIVTFAESIDVNGDGFSEIVGWWFAYRSDSDVFAGDAYLFWNGPEGFAGTCPDRIVVPTGQHIMTIAALRSSSGESRLAIATTGGAYLATVGESGEAGACADGANGSSCSALLDEGPLRAIGVVDYDLDGLEDLVVSTTTDIQILKQKSQDEVVLEESAPPSIE